MNAEMEARAEARQERADARQEKANAEMKASQERASAKMKVVQAEIKAAQAEIEARADARQDKADARLDQCKEEIKSRQEKADADAKARYERSLTTMRSIPSDIDRSLQQQIVDWKVIFLSSEERTRICRVLPMACPDNSEGDVIISEESSEEMDSTRLEATPEETEADVITSEESSEEIEPTNLGATPQETEAALERYKLRENEINAENIGSSEDRYGEKRSAARRRRGAKKRSQASVGSQQKLSAARKRVIRRAIPAGRKGNIRKGPGKDSTARRAPKGRRLVKVRRRGHEYNIGIMNRGPKNQLRLRRTSSKNYRTPMKLEEENRIDSSTIELQDVIYWTFWGVRPQPKCKKVIRTD
jgi:hypothetical protein